MSKRKEVNRFEEVLANINKFNSISMELSRINDSFSMLNSKRQIYEPLLKAFENTEKLNNNISNSLCSFSEVLNTFDKNKINNNLSAGLCSFSEVLNTLNINKLNSAFNNFNDFFDKLDNISNKMNFNVYLDCANKYQKIFSNYISKKELTNNHLEYLNIVGDIYKEKLEIISYLDGIEEVKDINIDLEDKLELKAPETLIPVYYGYTYRKDSKENIEEEYVDSDFEKIIITGKNIMKLTKDINIIYKNNEREYLFKYGPEIVDLATYIGEMSQDEKGFKSIIDILYKGLVESSNVSGNNKILEMNVLHSSMIMKIKYYRNFFDHELSNGERKVKEVIEYNKEKIGKSLPDKPKEWLKLQACLYEDIEIMLEEVRDKLNN